MKKNRLAACILAAGQSKRMGQPKLLLPLAGQPLLSHTLSLVAQFSFHQALVIVPPNQPAYPELCTHYGLSWQINSQAASGQSSSVQVAIRSLQPDLDGVLFFPGDQPLLSPELVAKILNRAAPLPVTAIVLPEHLGRWRSPVLFGSVWFEQLAALSGDRGGKQVALKHPNHVYTVPWEQEKDFLDADTWDDYQAICAAIAEK